MFDMYYVENWSLSLDLAIIFSTATSVVVRAFRQVGARAGLGGRESDSDGDASGGQGSIDRAMVLTPAVVPAADAASALAASGLAAE
jgi:hypothetical protein